MFPRSFYMRSGSKFMEEVATMLGCEQSCVVKLPIHISTQTVHLLYNRDAIGANWTASLIANRLVVGQAIMIRGDAMDRSSASMLTYDKVVRAANRRVEAMAKNYENLRQNQTLAKKEAVERASRKRPVTLES